MRREKDMRDEREIDERERERRKSVEGTTAVSVSENRN